MNFGSIAALDCRAVLLNINYGHNSEIMGKCRRMEEYSIFVAKVGENLKRKMPIEKAIDYAVNDVLKKEYRKEL